MEQEGHQNVWWGTVPLRKGSMGNRREEIWGSHNVKKKKMGTKIAEHLWYILKTINQDSKFQRDWFMAYGPSLIFGLCSPFLT
jgi:hypothetical protein